MKNIFIFLSVLFLFVIVGAGLVFTAPLVLGQAPPSPTAYTACNVIKSGDAIPTGYGTPYNVLSSGQELLMKASCSNTQAILNVGNEDQSQYIYRMGWMYKAAASAWTPITLTSSEQLISDNWFPKRAQATLSLTSQELSQENYVAAFICTWTGAQWKCGCSDSSCIIPRWQIQKIKRIPPPSPTPSPSSAPNEQYITLQEGQREGPLLVEKIYPDYVTGKNFPEYPIATNQGYPVILHIGESANNGCTITLTLVRIEGTVATFLKTTDYTRPCPICLAQHTLIDTPRGMTAVQDLQEGDEVWTLNNSGIRVPGKILRTARTPVPLTHHMIHLILDDGRELFASPGHPTSDGRALGNLSPGDFLDGSRVKNVETLPYTQDFTYDILPSGQTGLYWANGILMGSTLFHAE